MQGPRHAQELRRVMMLIGEGYFVISVNAGPFDTIRNPRFFLYQAAS